MPKPQTKTLDSWLNCFASWTAKDREFALQQAAICHEWTLKAERRLRATSPDSSGEELPFTANSKEVAQ